MSAPLVCGECDASFRGRSDAIYCSSACRQKAHRGRTARRLAVLMQQQRPGQWHARATGEVTRPDVARTIQRSQRELRRSLELRSAADIVQRETVLLRRRSAAGRPPHDVRPMPWSGWSDDGGRAGVALDA